MPSMQSLSDLGSSMPAQACGTVNPESRINAARMTNSLLGNVEIRLKTKFNLFVGEDTKHSILIF